ncbi:MAG: hypothetical protein PHD82_15220, partial [Candidatus Riflebacteria bacterium]|nr:hypothetical protein [Candidatus Riflebacteria bacterium]
MSDNSVTTTKIRQLRPRQIRLERLMLFWVLAVLLPAAAIFCLLNYSEFKNLDANRTRTVDLMLETYYKLQRACDYDEYFSNQIRNIERLAGLPERGSGFIPDQTALNNVSERLFRLFGRLKNHQLLLLIAAGNNLNNTRVFTDTTSSSDYPMPGLRAAREILAEYRRLSIAGRKPGEKQTSNRKILKSFATSIFGTYLNPLDADEDFTSGFSEKSGGGRIFSARQQVLSPDGQPLFSYIALFRETDNPLAHSFALARRQLADSGFSI